MRLNYLGIAGALGALALLAVPHTADADGETLRARSALVRSVGSPDADVSGRVAVMVKNKDGGRVIERLRVHVDDSDEAVIHLLYLEDDAAILQFVAFLTPDEDEPGELGYHASLKSKRGNSIRNDLPLGVASVLDLAGRALEVRLDDGAGGELPLLEGVVPEAVSGKGPHLRAKADLDPTVNAPDADGKIKLRSRPVKGDERLELHAEGLDTSLGQTYHMFLEDPAALGTFVDQGALAPDPDEPDQLELKIRTKDGDPLPFGVATVGDLAGLAIEVRDGATGDVMLTGTVPSF
ncbi:MAG: hypothetical protein JRG83_16145 [Deltaproteobacteria bacterium]|nr:hypothetical protein [Deltaproteobacteria bacterium]